MGIEIGSYVSILKNRPNGHTGLGDEESFRAETSFGTAPEVFRGWLHGLQVHHFYPIPLKRPHSKTFRGSRTGVPK